MALARLEYSWSFPPTQSNINPRDCQLTIKRDPDSFVFTEASLSDKDAKSVNFSQKHYRFLVVINNAIAFDSTSITPASQLNTALLTGEVEITSKPLSNGQSTTTLVVPLADQSNTVRIRVISIKTKVPMQNYTDIEELPQLKSNLLFHDRILPIDSFYVSQTIDQRDLQRNLGIGAAIAFVPNFSAGIGKGYGTWQFYDKKTSSKPKDFSVDNFDLFYRFAFEGISSSISLDIGLGAGIPFTLTGALGGIAIGESGGTTSFPVAGAQRVEIQKTYEAQRLRYDHKNTDIKKVIDKVKENFKLYSDVYEIPAPDDPTNPTNQLSDFDVDGDDKETIIDRITYLSSTIGYNSLSGEKSIPKFGNDSIKELKELIDKHGIIGKPIVVKDITGLNKVNSITLDGNTADSLDPLEVFSVKDNPNVYVVFEEGVPDGFEVTSTGKYTAYCKCMCPEWNAHFDYFSYKDIGLILGLSDSMSNIFVPLFGTKSTKDLTSIENPMVLLIIRGYTIISTASTANNTPAKITVRNTDHNDVLILQKKDDDDIPLANPPSNEGIRPNSFIANVPLDKEYSINQVNYVQGSQLYSLVPGYDIQTRGSHGLYFVSIQEPDLAQPKIQGTLNSPFIIMNPLDDPDTLNGSQSIFNKGATLEVFSNMGRQRDSFGDLSADLPFFSPTSSGTGSIGGNLDYLFESVSTQPEFLTPSLIAYKSNIKSNEEYVVYKSGNGNVVNYKILRGNKRLLSAVSNFSYENPSFENVNRGTVYTDSNSDVIQLNLLNQEIVEINRDEENNFVIENFGNINTVSQIKITFGFSVSQSGSFPYVLFYSNSESENTPFGETDQNGNVIPKIFNFKPGNNFLHCKNIEDVSKIVLKPALGIVENIDFENVGDPTECIVYGPQETNLSKNPVAQVRLENGSQFLLLEISTDSNSPTAIVCAEIHTTESKINYPSLYSGSKQTTSNQRLEQFNQTDFIAGNLKASKDQYMLLGYFDEANVIDERGILYIIGFLYDQSGGRTNTLASIPIPKQQISSGNSVFDIYKNFDQFLNAEPQGTNSDGGKFPWFVIENSKNFIVDKDIDNKQKPGIAKMKRNGIKLIFMADSKGSPVCYYNDNICRQWKKMPDNFVNNLFNYRERTSKEDGSVSRKDFKNHSNIKFVRFACSKETFSDELFLFALCEIKGSRYFVMMTKIPFDAIEFYSQFATLTLQDPKLSPLQINESQEQPILDKMLGNKPVLAIGNPNLILPDESLEIRVGNSKLIENNYKSLNLLLSDGETSPNDQNTEEDTLDNLQNIDISQDLQHGIIKIYYINNLGLRDVKSSLASGKTFQSYTSF